MKRALDLVLGGAMLVVVSLPLALVALAIKLEDGGPVFFRQWRAGRNGIPFRVLKFRTMRSGEVENGVGRQLRADDPWFTNVGRILRRWGLDELPQLVNVLCGEMSLVGPRPTLLSQAEQYGEFERQRLIMKPGITGLALILGRNNLAWEKRIEFDVQYITHWSLWLDIKILFRTLWVVLVTHEGVYSEDESS